MTKLQTLIGAALAAPTPAERLSAFLAIDGAGLPGVTGLRERQDHIRARQRKPAPAPVKWTSRQYRFDRQTRDNRRAHDSGDAATGLLLAESYPAHITPLFKSKRAGIVYGYKPEPVTDWDAYAKSYGRPANYSNAAYHVRYDGNDAVVVLHSVRGRDISLPLVRGVRYHHPGLLDGDLYARERRAGIAVRYNLKDESTGFAVRFPLPQDSSRDYWEHGATLDECRREYERKRGLARVARMDARGARKARLIARLCGGLACTVDDARALGYCRAGIDAFRDRYQLAETATARELRATGAYQAARVIERAAQRCAVTQEGR